MSLVVETGAVVAGAESYATVAEFDTYWTNRGNTALVALTDAEKEVLLRVATRYLDSQYKWRGKLVNTTAQVLDWPRQNVIDADGRHHDSDEIPTILKEAVFEVAKQHNANDLHVTSTTRKVTREKLDVLEQEFTPHGTDTVQFPWIDGLIKPLIIGGTAAVQTLRG